MFTIVIPLLSSVLGPWTIVYFSPNPLAATKASTATATATAVVTGTDPNIKTFTADGMPVVMSEATDYTGVIVTGAKNRPRMVGVCVEGGCEKRWVVAA
jgi:hypothetical protein